MRIGASVTGGRVRAGVLLALVGMLCAQAAAADLQTGLRAYRDGDYGVALAEFEPLARDGDASAQFNLAQMLRQGHGVDRDLEAAAQWYRAAARQGLPLAQFNLGVMYEKGMGVESSLLRAAEWFQRAAENGHGGAMQALEEMRDSRSRAGVQLRRDRIALLRRAHQGDARAQYELGLAYALGVGGTSDMSLAARWLREAARAGVAGARIQLGVMYANGQGVQRDLIEAYAWLSLAGDDARARRNLEALGRRLAPAQRDRARARAEVLVQEAPGAS